VAYRQWVYITSFIFAIGITVGVIAPANFGPIQEIIGGLDELGNLLLPSTFLMLIVILLKNFIALLLSFILSPFFLIVPTVSLFLNGWVIGLVSLYVIKEYSLVYLLTGVLPHGIFEIPAFIIAHAAAFNIGLALMQALFIKTKRGQLRPRIMTSVKYMAIACILLVPAAIVETFVTPMIMGV